MAVSYNKLWKLLIDRKMKKKELIELSGISKSTVTKMTHDEHVSTEMIAKIVFLFIFPLLPMKFIFHPVLLWVR